MIPLYREAIHPTWQPIINSALSQLDPNYLTLLESDQHWLPGPEKIFNAFTLPLTNVNYILFGESPYPRIESANGYAFWDQAVNQLWSTTGLALQVNRATSLRNIIKMLLIAEGYLTASDVSQTAIASLDKTQLIQTGAELFNRLVEKGFLLWNASLVLSSRKVKEEANYWIPFIELVLTELHQRNPRVKLLLWGKVAEQINTLPAARLFKQYISEHPYNLSFIHHQTMQELFKPLQLLTA